MGFREHTSIYPQNHQPCPEFRSELLLVFADPFYENVIYVRHDAHTPVFTELTREAGPPLLTRSRNGMGKSASDVVHVRQID
jgi:hypothetical protein